MDPLTPEEQARAVSVLGLVDYVVWRCRPGDDDARSEAYLRVCRSIRRHNPRLAAWPTYAAVVARSAAMTAASRAARRRRLLNGDCLETVAGGHAGPRTNREDVRRILDVALRTLRTRTRTLLVLHVAGGFTFRECGRIYGISGERARQICDDGLRRARRALAEAGLAADNPLEDDR